MIALTLSGHQPSRGAAGTPGMNLNLPGTPTPDGPAAAAGGGVTFLVGVLDGAKRGTGSRRAHRGRPGRAGRRGAPHRGRPGVVRPTVAGHRRTDRGPDPCRATGSNGTARIRFFGTTLPDT